MIAQLGQGPTAQSYIETTLLPQAGQVQVSAPTIYPIKEKTEVNMPERYSDRIHTEHAVLDIGDDVGALIIYCRSELRGRQIDVSMRGREWQRIHTDVLERHTNSQPIFAALFLSLPAGD